VNLNRDKFLSRNEALWNKNVQTKVVWFRGTYMILFLFLFYDSISSLELSKFIF